MAERWAVDVLNKWAADVLSKAKAWLVTGPVGRGLSFALDFTVALRQIVARRRTQP
jgi:hypothetical protein